jgi:dTDP-4-amino-4,6-dideoxygalactose transaminase
MHLFRGLTKNLSLTHPTIKSDSKPSPFGLAFTVESKEMRTRLVNALRANDIDCRLPTGGSFRLHKYGLPWANQKTPNADHIHNTGMFIGNAPYAIPDRIEKAVEVMKEIL